MDMLELLKAQLDKNTGMISKVTKKQMSGSTPCANFDAKALINHMVVGNRFFISVAQGNAMQDTGGEPPDMIGDDAARAHRKSGEDLLKAMREPGAMERTFDFGFAQMPGAMALGLVLMETTVHGWDLAKATGQGTSIDPEVAGMLYQGAQAIDGMRTPEGNPFGPKVDVPDSASPGDKLVAFLGRNP